MQTRSCLLFVNPETMKIIIHAWDWAFTDVMVN